MAYKTTRDVSFNLKDYPAGLPISFAEDDQRSRDELLACGAIEGEEDDADDGDSELSKLTVAELTKLAEDEGVTDVPEKAKKAVIIAAIKAKRTSAPADAGGTTT